jgi:hypothetical protein
MLVFPGCCLEWNGDGACCPGMAVPLSKMKSVVAINEGEITHKKADRRRDNIDSQTEITEKDREMTLKGRQRERER